VESGTSRNTAKKDKQMPMENETTQNFKFTGTIRKRDTRTAEEQCGVMYS
jgi:hypothetical protein